MRFNTSYWRGGLILIYFSVFHFIYMLAVADPEGGPFLWMINVFKWGLMVGTPFILGWEYLPFENGWIRPWLICLSYLVITEITKRQRLESWYLRLNIL